MSNMFSGHEGIKLETNEKKKTSGNSPIFKTK